MLIRCLFSGLLRGADVYPAAGRSTLLPSLWGGRFFRPGVEPAQLSNAGPLVLVQGVAVFVHRDGRIGVAQQPGERYNVHPLFQGPGGEGVTEGMEIGVLDPRLPHTALEQVLIGPGLIGLAVLLTEHVALLVVAGVFGGNGVLNLFVILQVLEKLVQEIDGPSGVVRLGGGHRIDSGGCRDGIVVVGKPVPRLADL